MRRSLFRPLALLCAAAVAVPLTALAAPALAAPPPGGDWHATTLHGQKVSAVTAPSARLARTDPSLLQLTSSDLVPVVVKLDYDPLASYRGGVAGFAATSPSVTGHKLNRRLANVAAYEKHVVAQESTVLRSIRDRVASARIGRSLRVVYGGVAMRVPGNQIS